MKDEVVTQDVETQAEIVAGVLPLTTAHRDQLRKHTLFRKVVVGANKGTLSDCMPLSCQTGASVQLGNGGKSKIVWSHNGEINDEYSCFVCVVKSVVRNIIIVDSCYSQHMFSDWRIGLILRISQFIVD